jgi:plastocyanin
MSSKRKMLIIFFVILLFITGYGPWFMASAGTNSGTTMYLSLVNDAFGFYKIRNLETVPRQFTYENHILNINLGDTIIWENDADISTLTIVSDQNLWNDQVGKIKVGQKINYKFDKPGIYTFHLKEASSKQTIIVGDIGEVPTVAQIPTVTYTTHVPTEIYTPSYTETVVPTKTVTIVATPNSTQQHSRARAVPSLSIPDIKIPIRLTPTSFASMAVGILSLYITFRRKK